MAEQAVLQFTSDTTTRLPISHALAAEAAKLIQTLAQLLAAATVKQRAGPVVIAAVKALGYCCLQRPQLLSTTLPPLLTLAQQVGITHTRAACAQAACRSKPAFPHGMLCVDDGIWLATCAFYVMQYVQSDKGANCVHSRHMPIQYLQTLLSLYMYLL